MVTSSHSGRLGNDEKVLVVVTVVVAVAVGERRLFTNKAGRMLKRTEVGLVGGWVGFRSDRIGSDSEAPLMCAVPSAHSLGTEMVQTDNDL